MKKQIVEERIQPNDGNPAKQATKLRKSIKVEKIVKTVKNSNLTQKREKRRNVVKRKPGNTTTKPSKSQNGKTQI